MPKKLHLCVGFYPDGTYVANTVRDEDLQNNIEYNKTYRPGRYGEGEDGVTIAELK